MQIVASPKTIQQATAHLRAHDPVLAEVIDQYGLCDITPHTNYYQELVESIIGQQLSVKAASSIRKRFLDMFGGTFPKPAAILEKSLEDLRGIGFSYAKARYVQDLALHVLEGRLTFDRLDQLDNPEVIAKLTDVKGIGEWTAHMFMMFCMGRLDVLPVGDLGIKNGIMKLYGLDTQPDEDKIREMAASGSWHPYESVASWYIWRSLDNMPKVEPL